MIITLHLYPSVHPGDQGVYVCSAANQAGSVMASAMLRVQVTIIITTLLCDILSNTLPSPSQL